MKSAKVVKDAIGFWKISTSLTRKKKDKKEKKKKTKTIVWRKMRRKVER